MAHYELCLRSHRVVDVDGMRAATICVRAGRIAALLEHDAAVEAEEVEDLGDQVVMPGLFDAHVHVNEPGRAEWEGFATATRAAAAGGITGLVDMPLNSVPSTIDVAALQAKRRSAEGQCRVDVGFWGGVVPGNAAELEGLWRAGVLGFKCFLSPSGVDEFDNVGVADLEEAMPVLARLGAPLLCHAEWPATLDAAARAWSGKDADPRAYATYLATRPPAAEVDAIEALAELAGRFGAQVHVVHVASGEGAEAVARARAAGVAMSAETCPHYLHFSAEEIADGDVAYKCAPPIRGRAQREQLWAALRAGTLDYVATDHSPSPPERKGLEQGRFDAAWGGIASLQLLLPATWTGAAARGVELPTLSRWLSAEPAARAGLEARKGRLRPGADADLVVWRPDESFTVDAGALEHRHPITPYAGHTLRGVVVRTYLRGQPIFDRDSGVGPDVRGRFLTRPSTTPDPSR